MTVRVIVVVWVSPPPSPFTVIVYDPAFTLLATLIVRVDVPEPLIIDAVLKDVVGPVGVTEAVSVTVLEKPPDGETVMVAVPELPCWIESVV